MKKTLFIALIIMFAIASVNVSYSQTKSKKTAKKAKPITGYVVSLNNLMMSGTGIVTKDVAEGEAAKGSPILFMSGKTIYFVYNTDGTFAGKKLAKEAETKKLNIYGKTKKVKGLNVIIMDSMDK